MKYEQMNNNKVMLTGKVVSKAKFSHETFGEGFYELTLAIPRLSDKEDLIPVLVSEKLLTDGKFEVGNTVRIKGQFRSYNKNDGEKSKLVLTVFVREVVENMDETVNPNIIEINGFICKPPIYRTTPFKREICDILVAVNRAYNKSDYLPCIAWGRNARYIKNIQIGSKLFIVGRIQSREYQKKLEDGQIENKTAYEISITRIQTDGVDAIDENLTNHDDDAINI